MGISDTEWVHINSVMGFKDRFESCPDHSSYLTPNSTVTTIGALRKLHEWWRKVRRTCNGRVPKTKETRHMGDHTLVFKSLPK
jgi:hypothetical protein